MWIEDYRSLLNPVRRGLGPQPAAPGAGGAQLKVTVVFTTASGTAAALKAAQTLAGGLGGRTVLLAPEIVPLQFPLTDPPVSIGFTEGRICEMARRCQKDTDIEIRVLLCRDARQCLLQVLPPRSLVLLGRKKRWWPRREHPLAKVLRGHGHTVMVIEGE